MRYFVTGATGLIGRSISDQLAKSRCNQVRALSRQNAYFQSRNIHSVVADLALLSREELVRMLDTSDCLIHCAAHMSHVSNQDLIDSGVVNIDGTNNLFLAAIDAKLKLIIYISGFNFLAQPLETPVVETHPLGARNLYGCVKLWGELSLFHATQNCSTRAISLRVSSPLPKQPVSLPRTFLRSWLEAARERKDVLVFGRGTRRQDFVAISDIAEAVILASTSSYSGIYNIASGTTVSNVDIANLIAAKFGVGVAHQGIDLEEGINWDISIEKARKQLGFSPRFSSLQNIEILLRSAVS